MFKVAVMVAVLPAELGDVARFRRTDQAIAYGGLDIEIKESGLWKGKAKLSKRGSGLLRRVLYLAALRSTHTEGSAFGAYYHRLVARGLKKGSALMAVMRKMLASDNGISTSYFQLYDAGGGKVAVTLNNFCKLQDMGADDEDDILSCVHFLLVDVLSARGLLSGLQA